MCRSSERPPMLDINFNRLAPYVSKTNYQQLINVQCFCHFLNRFFFNAPVSVKAGMDMGKIHQKMNEHCLIECMSNI